MSTLNVTNLAGRGGITPNLPDGAVISGINTIDASGIKVGNGIVLSSGGGTFSGNITANALSGDGSNLTGTPGPTLSFVADGALASAE